LTGVFIKYFLTLWKSTSLKFQKNLDKSPNLVLISGSSACLDSLNEDLFTAPAIFTFERKDKAKPSRKDFKYHIYRHCLNGGCTFLRLTIGFFKLRGVAGLTSIKQCIGNFLDYSIHPTKRIPIEAKGKYLSLDEVLDPRRINNWIAIPTY